MIMEQSLPPQPLVYLKIHHSHKNSVTAACDHELIGKTFTDTLHGIKLVTSPHFYKGELVTIAESLNAIRVADNVNLVGTHIISAVLKEHLAHEHAVLIIHSDEGKIPHLQIYHV